MADEMSILEDLKAVGCSGKFLNSSAFAEALSGGPNSDLFRELVTWISNEIRPLRQTEEKIANESNVNDFMLELSAFLKELGCPYTQLVAGPLSERLQTRTSRLLLLEFIITELMASKMHCKFKPEETSYIIPVKESSTASALQSITKELSLGKPPENIAPKDLFDKISKKLEGVIKKTSPKKLSDPLFKTAKPLSDDQWTKLENLHTELDDEYNLRRELLLTRLDVTVQSFQWCDKMKGRENEIIKTYEKERKELNQLQFGGNETNISSLLAARMDTAIIEKTSNATVRKNTGSKVQKHVIGKVPDRGGRAYEHQPPPPEMPSWQQNRAPGPQGRGGFNSRGGGGRGGAQYNQDRPFDQRQNLDQRESFQQRQPNQYNQKQYNNRGGNSGWTRNGNNRVQGGWSHQANDGHNMPNQKDNFDDYQSRNPRWQQQPTQSRGNQDNYNSYDREGNSFREKSNYNRGRGGRR